uniref:nucleotidyl transferase AbiEii/AbiGii toxin family protein n=1 Tax=Halomonas sp. TaxID=1486246 RepID=UPI0026065635|nr:nucleotidyl transferase AbiEii/AbiGii toxin family protein [Halomonas sp.]
MAREDYEAQVALLVRILPYVAEEEVFALKGGTATNLFYRDMPRLSVDIDLTYLPVKDRTESLAEINEAMDHIATAIERPQAANLPAVRWKLINLNKLIEQNAEKYLAQRKELEALF